MRAKNAPFLRACAHFSRARVPFSRARVQFLRIFWPNCAQTGGVGRMPHMRFKGGRMCAHAILPKACACAHNTLAQTKNPSVGQFNFFSCFVSRSFAANFHVIYRETKEILISISALLHITTTINTVAWMNVMCIVVDKSTVFFFLESLLLARKFVNIFDRRPPLPRNLPDRTCSSLDCLSEFVEFGQSLNFRGFASSFFGIPCCIRRNANGKGKKINKEGWG